MTHLDELRALAERWRRAAKDWEVTGFDARASACRLHADELTKLLGKAVVTDEMVGTLRQWIVGKTGMRIHPDELRAALQAALGEGEGE